MRLFQRHKIGNITVEYYHSIEDTNHYLSRLITMKEKTKGIDHTYKDLYPQLYLIRFNDTKEEYIDSVLCECVEEDIENLKKKYGEK